MPRSSYYVLSDKYIGPPSVQSSVVPQIDAKDIKSMKFEPITVSSFPWGSSNNNFTKEGVVTRTANNRFVTSYQDYLKYGNFYERGDFEIDGMKKAGEDVKPNMFNVIPRMPEFAYITGITPLGLYLPDKRDTKVDLQATPEIVNAVNPNRVGFYNSINANNYTIFRSIEFDKRNNLSEESVAWIDFLSRKGISIDKSKNPGLIGIGIENGDFSAAYYPGKGYLVTELDFHEKSKRLISRYGLSNAEAVEAMKRSILLHEIAHVLGVKGDRKSEKLQGELQAEFYSRMAELHKGTKLERIYLALAREGKDYAEKFSKSQFWEDILADPFEKTSGPIDAVVAKFEVEAREMGLKGKAFHKYVESRIKETYGALLGGEPSYKKSRKQQSSKEKESQSRKKNLDEIVNEADEPDSESNPKTKYSKSPDKSEYKSMNDAKEREAMSEKADAPQETAEAPAE